MRIPFASLAALAVLAVTLPAFAQSETPAAPAPKPIVKHKTVSPVAHCNALKTSSARAACLKRIHAQATHAKPPAKSKVKKPSTTAQLTPPAPMPTPTAPSQAQAPAAPAPSSSHTPPQTISVPPLPQKTI